MKLWTYQSKYTMDKLVENGIYYPNFKNGLDFAKNTSHAYRLIKNDYMEINNLKCEGLIFGLSHYNNKEISNFDEYKYVINDSGVAGCSTTNPDCYLLELEIPEEINPNSCQFYNFSDVIAFLDRDEECTSKELISYIQDLYSDESCVNLVQSHIHYIDIDMIKGIHNVYGGEYNRETFEFIRKEVEPNNIQYYRNLLMRKQIDEK